MTRDELAETDLSISGYTLLNGGM